MRMEVFTVDLNLSFNQSRISSDGRFSFDASSRSWTILTAEFHSFGMPFNSSAVNPLTGVGGYEGFEIPRSGELPIAGRVARPGCPGEYGA
jgi:hypothetical protein